MFLQIVNKSVELLASRFNRGVFRPLVAKWKTATERQNKMQTSQIRSRCLVPVCIRKNNKTYL